MHVLLYPTSPTPVSLIKTDPDAPRGGGRRPLNIANITGFPDLVVPCGMSERGLPVTFSLLGRSFTEGRLLAYAYDYKQATLPGHVPRQHAQITDRHAVCRGFAREALGLKDPFHMRRSLLLPALALLASTAFLRAATYPVEEATVESLHAAYRDGPTPP
ncbi:MAG: hypothetical protein J6386_02040 [Candidatus Synoicihabitans palmerolidicus]|nr:hypothetical protein [Candidatus Synoicihabitans palmerolidicus]